MQLKRCHDFYGPIKTSAAPSRLSNPHPRYSMKISRWFRQAGFITQLRIALAVLLLAAGAAIAIVGTRPAEEKKTALLKMRGDPDRDVDADNIMRLGPEE